MAHQNELVSVAMTVMNPDPVFFPQAVESVLGQSHQNLELVIVEDPGERSCAPMLAKLPDPRVHHICNSRRTGHKEQRNCSLQASRGEFVAVLDADDVCYPDRMEKQLAFLCENRDVGVIGSQTEIIDSRGKTLGWREYPVTHASIMKAMTRFNALAHPSVMMRKRQALSAGGYRNDSAAHDYDLWSRMAVRGVKFWNYPRPLLKYRIHGSAIKATRLRETLRVTIDIKKEYWSDAFDARARLRLLAEKLFLCLPAQMVYTLFCWSQFRRIRPRSLGEDK